MTYRTADKELTDRRASEQASVVAERDRFAKELRRRNLGNVPGPIVFLVLVPVGTVAGCSAGSIVSHRLGTVGDMAGGFQWAGRVTIGGVAGFVVALVGAVVIYRRLRRLPRTRP